jgi:ABC-type branched-subunit amino acid transport system ATPase component
MKNDTPATVIEVKNLSCGYGETVVLQDVSFAVHPRELLFVIEAAAAKAPCLGA